MASSTVLPSTRSTITDRLACEMEQPWPSHTNRLMVCGSSSETSTWMVASSPQVGLNWCDSPGVQYSWLACTVTLAAASADCSTAALGAKDSLPCGCFDASRMTSWYICSRSSPLIPNSFMVFCFTPLQRTYGCPWPLRPTLGHLRPNCRHRRRHGWMRIGRSGGVPAGRSGVPRESRCPGRR